MLDRINTCHHSCVSASICDPKFLYIPYYTVLFSASCLYLAVIFKSDVLSAFYYNEV